MKYDRELNVMHYYKTKGLYDKQFLKEAELQKHILEFLSMLPETKVVRVEAGNTAGISDLLVCYKGQFIAIELKDNTGEATPQQIEFIKDIIDAGGKGAICRTIKDVYILLKR